MSRRRMMMLQLSKPDLLEGYRSNNTGGAYNIYIKWLDNSIVQMYYTAWSFKGPSTAAKGFINSWQSSTSYGTVLGTTPMNTVELGKTYKLTLTVTEVLQNTATTDNDGTFTVAFGRPSYVATKAQKISEIKVGTKFETTLKYENAWACISGAAIEVNNPNLQWNFKFKVTLEEV